MTTPGTADPGVSRVTAVALATHLVDMYTGLETRLATDIARRLAAGMDAPDWAQRKLAAVGELRRQARVLLLRAQRETEGEITQALLLAYARGGTEAMRTISRLQNTLPEWLHLADINDPGPRIREALSGKRSELDRKLDEINNAFPGIAGVMRIVRSLILRIRGTHLPVLRWAEDVYREVIAKTSLPSVLFGVATRRRAAQVAWETLLSQGVTGFVDRSGRRWDLASYVEMAVRTGVAQAAIEGHMDRLADARIDLVVISNAPQECILCRPWEGKILARTGAIGPRVIQMEHAFRDGQMVTVRVAGTLAEAIASGLFHPNCFPAEVLVSAPSGVVAADARRYQGPLVVIHTASGDELPVTPNHPVLTPEGWVPAGQLQVGQSVLRYRADVEDATLSTPDDHQVPARISDVFNALRQASPMPPLRMPVAAEDFHGDGFDTDVDVVLADGLLGNTSGQELGEAEFLGGGVGPGALLTDGASFEIVGLADRTADGVMGGGDLGGSFVCVHGRPLAPFGFAAIGAVAAAQQGGADGGLRSAETLGDLALGHAFQVEADSFLDPIGLPLLGHSGGPQLSVEGGPVDAHGGRDVVGALAGRVAADRVVKVEQRGEWSGHVYNLQTRGGWYVANSLVVSNCRHSAHGYVPGVTRIPTHTADPEGDKARQRLRHLERQVRKNKLLGASAIDPAAAKEFKAKVRVYQEKIRDHVAATGLHRQPQREQIGTAR